MSDMDELTSNPTPLTTKQHKWVRRVVGALSYYANTTRFDISYEVNRVAQYLQAPTIGTIKALKRILAYLAGTVDRVARVVWPESVRQTGKYTLIVIMRVIAKLTRPVVLQECW